MQTTSFSFEAIGTAWQIDIPSTITAYRRSQILEKIIALIEDFDHTYSRFRPDSLITQMSQKKGSFDLPANSLELLDLYKNLYRLTGGLFTPLIGQLLADAGYDSAYSLYPKKLQQPPPWEDILDFKFPRLILKKPALLDFGAAGKGYLIDLVGQLIRKNKISSFIIDAGGDILYIDRKRSTLEVALEHPDHPDQIIGTATITNQSICASSGNRRRWKNFHHIINPSTLTSPTNIKAVWVIAQKALIADGLTTCLFFVPPSRLQTDYEFEYLIIHDDLSFDISPGFPGKIFTTHLAI